MNTREAASLDRHITGNYGEDFFKNNEVEIEDVHLGTAKAFKKSQLIFNVSGSTYMVPITEKMFRQLKMVGLYEEG